MIYGDRIRFRGVERSDLPSFVNWINDPEILEGIGLFLPFSTVDEDRWFEHMLDTPLEEHILAVEAREVEASGGGETWKLIGSLGFFGFDRHSRSAELGINIGAKSYWNRGYGTEAVRLLVKHGFETLNLHRIFLRVYETNKRAIRAYEKAGFTHEVRMRQAEYRNGRYLDVLVMSILHDEVQHA